jgi:hypothetical protein
MFTNLKLTSWLEVCACNVFQASLMFEVSFNKMLERHFKMGFVEDIYKSLLSETNKKRRDSIC